MKESSQRNSKQPNRDSRAFALIMIFTVSVGLFASPSVNAADPVLTKIVQIAAIALGEPGLNQAVDLIDCVRFHGPEYCAKNVAQTEGQKAAQQFVPSDPKIAATIKIVKAAYASDWLEVLELTGTEALVPIACSAGLTISGPFKAFICGEASKYSKPIVKIVLTAIKNPSPDNLLKSIAALGNPNLACSLIDFPGKDAICGPLGEIVQGLANGVKSAVGALGDVAEDIAGQSQHIPVENYYLTYWRPSLHYSVVKQLQYGQPQYLFAGWKGGETCVEYFDSHKMSESNAKKVCSIMKNRFKQEVDETVNVFLAYPDTFLASVMAPKLPTWGIQYFGKIDNFANYFSQTQDWKGNSLQTYLQANKPPFRDMWGACLGHIPLKLPPVQGAGVHPAEKANMGTAYSWACVKAVGQHLGTALAKQKTETTKLIPTLAANDCGHKTLGENPKLYFVCNSYESWNQCKTTVLGAGGAPNDSYCGINATAAITKLATQIAGELGKKRCNVTAMNPNNVECTRPWKRQKCEAIVKQRAAGAGTWVPTCSLKNDPRFVEGKAKAQEILNLLNGVVKAGKTVSADGKTDQLVMVPPKKPCSHQLDPLAIRCTDPNVLAPFKGRSDMALGRCPPDPNQDGADKPCYVELLKLDSAKTAPLSSKTTGGPITPTAATSTTKAPVSLLPAVGLAKPQLAVLGVQSMIEANCQSPQPALTALVTVKNSGRALMANGGTIHIKEIGGANLGSNRIPLPSIGAGRTQVIHITASTLKPYSSLSGRHQLVVHLDPQVEGDAYSFDKPMTPYQFTASFPAGHCSARNAGPGPSRAPAGVPRPSSR